MRKGTGSMSPLGSAWSVSRVSFFGADSHLRRSLAILLAFALAVSVVFFAAPARADVPDPPVLVAPADLATGVSVSPTLEVTVSDPESDAMDVTFYGRLTGPLPGPDFSIIAIPDTQHYTDDGGANPKPTSPTRPSGSSTTVYPQHRLRHWPRRHRSRTAILSATIRSG